MSEQKEKVFKSYTIDLKNKKDRRDLMDVLCGKFNLPKKPAASEIDLIDFCVDNGIEFFGFKSETAPVYHLKVRFEKIDEIPSAETMIENPDTIPPNTKIGETESDLMKAKEFTPTEEEKREAKVEKRKAEKVEFDDDDFPIE